MSVWFPRQTGTVEQLTRLLLDAQRGDRDALERFVAATQHDALGLCRYLGDRDNADDVTVRGGDELVECVAVAALGVEEEAGEVVHLPISVGGELHTA